MVKLRKKEWGWDKDKIRLGLIGNKMELVILVIWEDIMFK